MRPRALGARALVIATALTIGVGAAAADRSRKRPAEPARVTGSIRGVVTFPGEVEPAAQQRRSDPFCAKTKGFDEAIVVSDGALRDVHVRLRPTAAQRAAAPAVPTTPVVIDQTACNYTPRVAGVVAGQPLHITNGDRTLHNVHAYRDSDTTFNRAQPQGAKPIVHDAAEPGIIELKCDVHPWMRAYAVVTDHGWFAVTGADGAFSIDAVPPGDYEIEAWHPTLGTAKKKITVTGGKPATVDFELKPKA